MENKRYIRKIVIIILLTNIIALLCLPNFFKSGIGWIIGSVGSAINFVWLAADVKQSINAYVSKAKIKAVKGSILRYLFLVFYTLVFFVLVKPNIITFGFGLLAAQIAIYIVEILENLKKNKYFRG